MKVRGILGVHAIRLGLFAFVVLSIFSLMGCTAHKTYPREKASLWVCEDPHFEMSYVSGSQVSYIEWEGKKYEVHVLLGMTANTFTVYPQSDDGVLRTENILLHGIWKYKEENMVVKIEEDNIFDGAYKKLIFVPQK